LSARRRSAGSGSRYLYEPFEFASVHRIEAHEKIVENQFDALERHFERLEAAVDRLEKRMWMSLYGVVGVILAEVLRAYLDFGLGG
jgi:hypothetical protein